MATARTAEGIRSNRVAVQQKAELQHNRKRDSRYILTSETYVAKLKSINQELLTGKSSYRKELSMNH